MIKNLIFSELFSFRWKSIIRPIIFFDLLLIIVIFFIVKPMLAELNVINPATRSIMGAFESIFITRLSFGIYFFVAWLLVPKIFFGKKHSGEIETIISMGFSAKDIWLSKSISIIIIDLILSLPVVTFTYFLFKLMIFFNNIPVEFNLLWFLINFLFLIIINPLILLGVILLAGGIQLVTNDFMKSTMIIYLIFFLNFFTFNLGTKSIVENVFYIIAFIIMYLIVIFSLFVYIFYYKRKITNENIIITLCDVDKIASDNIQKLNSMRKILIRN